VWMIVLIWNRKTKCIRRIYSIKTCILYYTPCSIWTVCENKTIFYINSYINISIFVFVRLKTNIVWILNQWCVSIQFEVDTQVNHLSRSQKLFCSQSNSFWWSMLPYTLIPTLTHCMMISWRCGAKIMQMS